MDNKIFNVNGYSRFGLQKALELLLMSDIDDKPRKVGGWYFDPEKGFVLLKYIRDEGHAFPVPLDYESLTNVVWQWLQESPDAINMRDHIKDDWDQNANHDGGNNLGWRVYVEAWGHIYKSKTLNHSTAGAIKPVYLWYGK